MIALTVLLCLGQTPIDLSPFPRAGPPEGTVEFSAPPLVKVEPMPAPPMVKLETFVAPPLVRIDEPPLKPAPAMPPATLLPAPGPVAKIQAPSARLQEINLFELTRRHSQLSLEIDGFDTSGPGWAQALRVVGYVLVLPAFIFVVPILSGNSIVAGTTSAISGSTTLTPTFNTIGLALAVTCAVALALGIGFGVAGWISKTFELNALKERRTALEVELGAAHGVSRP